MIRIIQISLFTLATLGLLVLMGFIFKESRATLVEDVQVNIFRDTDEGFLSRDILLNTINNIDTNKHLTITNVNTYDIERNLLLNPYIENTDSYLTLDGKLLINVKEKTPIIRVYNKQGNSIYIDNNGEFIPISRKHTSRVLIASGYINDNITSLESNIYDTTYSNSSYFEVFKLGKLILENHLLSSQINQIYVNSKGEYDLIPELGEHIIKFGSLENAAIKLENLEAYYRKNMITENWDKYSSINLIYKDQIVCTKK